MIELVQIKQRKEKDSTVALINIVFLMLVFFLIAGTIAPPLDRNVDPVKATTDDNAELKNTLSVRANGEVFYQGDMTTPENFITEIRRDSENTGGPLRILADKDLSAATLVDLINKLKSAGAPQIRIITQRQSS